MKLLVTGSSGLIGSALVPSLTREGHRVERLIRTGEGAFRCDRRAKGCSSAKRGATARSVLTHARPADYSRCRTISTATFRRCEHGEDHVGPGAAAGRGQRPGCNR